MSLKDLMHRLKTEAHRVFLIKEQIGHSKISTAIIGIVMVGIMPMPTMMQQICFQLQRFMFLMNKIRF